VNPDGRDPRDIPILTDMVEEDPVAAPIDIKALQSSVVAETLQLADSLLHQAARDIEATLFEHVFDRLRAELPELVDRIIREQFPTPHAESPSDE
jgi:Zn-dependent M32 family carboxypeptidase